MLNVRVPDALYDQINQIAATEGTSRTDVVVTLINRSLQTREARLAAFADRVLIERRELFERLA